MRILVLGIILFQVRVFRFVIGIYTVYHGIYAWRFPCCHRTFLSTNVKLFATRKPMSIPNPHLMSTIWKYFYTISWEDHQYNSKRGGGGFAITIKTHYLKVIRVKHLQICISFEVSVGQKCCKFIRLDRTHFTNSQVTHKMNLRPSWKRLT